MKYKIINLGWFQTYISYREQFFLAYYLQDTTTENINGGVLFLQS